MAEDQVTSGDIENPEEQQMELSLRPQTLDQYLGQKRVKKEMSIYIKAARQRFALWTTGVRKDNFGFRNC